MVVTNILALFNGVSRKLCDEAHVVRLIWQPYHERITLTASHGRTLFIWSEGGCRTAQCYVFWHMFWSLLAFMVRSLLGYCCKLSGFGMFVYRFIWPAGNRESPQPVPGVRELTGGLCNTTCDIRWGTLTHIFLHTVDAVLRRTGHSGRVPHPPSLADVNTKSTSTVSKN